MWCTSSIITHKYAHTHTHSRCGNIASAYRWSHSFTQSSRHENKTIRTLGCKTSFSSPAAAAASARIAKGWSTKACVFGKPHCLMILMMFCRGCSLYRVQVYNNRSIKRLAIASLNVHTRVVDGRRRWKTTRLDTWANVRASSHLLYYDVTLVARPHRKVGLQLQPTISART